jgi:preprotein translocase subunit SecF
MTFDFIKSRGVFYGISLLLSIGSLVAFFMLPLHLGIDMTGGSQMEFSYSGKVDLAEIRALAELSQTTVNSGSQVINNTTAYLISGEDKFIIEAGFNRPSSMNDADFEALKTQLKNDLINRL